MTIGTKTTKSWNVLRTSPPARSEIEKAIEIIAVSAINRGLGVGDISELVASAFVKVAIRLMSKRTGRPNQSQIAAATGLSRLEVRRLAANSHTANGKRQLRRNKALQVLRHIAARKTPRSKSQSTIKLTFSSSKSEFGVAVRKVAGDVPPAAVLKELVRLGLATQVKEGRVRYVVIHPERNAEDPSTSASQLEIMSGLLRVGEAQGDAGGSRAYLQQMNVDSEKTVKLLERDIQEKSRAFFESIGADRRTASNRRDDHKSVFKVALVHWVDKI